MIEPRNTPPDREPPIRMTAMPADANPSDDIFGGYILSLMGSISPNTSDDAHAATTATASPMVTSGGLEGGARLTVGMGRRERPLRPH